MSTTEQTKVVQKINDVISLIKGCKERYQICIIPNPINHYVTFSIVSKKENKFILLELISTNKNNYIDVINYLRDTFILYGALVSKLIKNSQESKVTYYQQSIYLDNLEIDIQINNKEEELEALKAHAKIMIPEIHESYHFLTKTLYNINASKRKNYPI